MSTAPMRPDVEIDREVEKLIRERMATYPQDKQDKVSREDVLRLLAERKKPQTR